MLPAVESDPTPHATLILVVDDDPSIRALMVDILEIAGMKAVVAASGTEALAILDEQTIELVLLDWGLPDIDGVQVLRTIRARPSLATLPVIMVTGRDATDERVEGLDAGADDYVSKPFELDELLARVRAHLRTHAKMAAELSHLVEQRAAIMRAVGSGAEGVEPLVTARRLCAELVNMNGVAGAVLIEMIGEHVEPIAATGSPVFDWLNAGAGPDRLGRYLRKRGTDGPWLEPLPDGNGPTPLAAAIAPLPRGNDQVAFLVTVPPVSARKSDLDRLLAATIDFAQLAAGMLADGIVAMIERATIAKRLKSTIDSRAYSIVYQPIVDLHLDVLAGYEALTRFHDGASTEGTFLQAAAVGIGHELEFVTLRDALLGAHRLPDDAWLSVNVSPSLTLRTDDLRLLLSGHTRQVVLEVSEHESVPDYEALRQAVAGMGARVQLSVDDAGSGFASLAHILALKAEFVKLDQTWVRGIHTDPSRQALVAGLQYFARETGASIIAEGVEEVEEVTSLREIGVRFAQGFLLGRPASY